MVEQSDESNGRVIIGRHFCLHCGSRLDRYLWKAATELERNTTIRILARGELIPSQERVVSLLKTLGCEEIERKVIKENGYETLIIIIKKRK